MKRMPESTMVKVFVADATAEAIDVGCEVMRDVAPEHKLKHGTSEGWFHCNEIKLDNKTIAVIWWSKGSAGNLFVEAVASLVDFNIWQYINTAVDMIAKNIGAKMVELKAVRLGIVTNCRQSGYRCEGVYMRKVIK